VVFVLATGPKVRGFNPAEDDEHLRAIKIRSTTSIGEKMKPSFHVVRVYSMLKDPVKLERETSSAKFTTNSLQVPPASLLDVSAGYFQRALEYE
jgi:hypothetical protein